jgi:predicted AAA+ superfamily ATPase
MIKIIERPVYLNQLISWRDSTGMIKIITGIRRSGKSTMFKLFQKYLLADKVTEAQIQDINLEDAVNERFLDWHELHDHIQKNLAAAKMNYVFLDEIQNVPAFQKAVNSLRLKENIDLYLTGSNSRILSGEFATLLSGRYIEISMLPLSFKEYISAYPYENAALDAKFNDYIHNSSFPYTVRLTSDSNPLLDKKNGWDTEQIRMFLKGMYDTIIKKPLSGKLNPLIGRPGPYPATLRWLNITT